MLWAAVQVRRAALLQRGCLRPVALVHAAHPDQGALDAQLVALFHRHDRDGDGGLNEDEFNTLVNMTLSGFLFSCFLRQLLITPPPHPYIHPLPSRTRCRSWTWASSPATSPGCLRLPMPTATES